MPAFPDLGDETESANFPFFATVIFHNLCTPKSSNKALKNCSWSRERLFCSNSMTARTSPQQLQEPAAVSPARRSGSALPPATATRRRGLQNICAFTLHFYNKHAKKTRKRATAPKQKDFHYFLIRIFSVSQKRQTIQSPSTPYHKVSLKTKQIYCNAQPVLIPSIT